MKALAIIALIFAGLAIFIPVGGVFLAMFCSVLALISFKSHPTLSGITFGIDVINTAFLSPSIMLTDMASSGHLGAFSTTGPRTHAGSIYWFYVCFHVVLFVIAIIIWAVLRRKSGSRKKDSELVKS